MNSLHGTMTGKNVFVFFRRSWENSNLIEAEVESAKMHYTAMVKMCGAEKAKSDKCTKLVKMKGMLHLWWLILLFINTYFAKKKFWIYYELLNQGCQWWISFTFTELTFISAINFCQKFNLNILTCPSMQQFKSLAVVKFRDFFS